MYTFSFIVGSIIQKSVKSIHSATKNIYIYIHLCICVYIYIYMLFGFSVKGLDV